MSRYCGWVIFAPVQLAAQNFGFCLEVESGAYSVCIITCGGGFYRFYEDIAVFKELFGIGADKLSNVNAGKRNPRYTVHFLKTQRFENSFFTCHFLTSLLNYVNAIQRGAKAPLCMAV